MSIRVKTGLTLTFGAIMLVLTLLLSLVLGYSAGKRVVQERGVAMADLAKQVASQLNSGLESRLDDLTVVASVSTTTGLFLQRVGATRIWLDELQTVFPGYVWIGFADPSGQVVVSTGQLLEGADVSARPWFQEGQKDVYFGNVHPAVLLEKLLPPRSEPRRFLDVALPVKLSTGQNAVLGAHLDWEWAKGLSNSVVSAVSMHGPVEALILDSDNQVLVGPESLGGTRVEGLKKAADKSGDNFFLHQWPDGESYLTGFTDTEAYPALKTFGWRIIVRQNNDFAMESVDELQSRVLLIGLTLALLFMLLIGWTAGWITRPLEVLTDIAERLRRGDRLIKFPERVLYEEGQHLVSSLESLFRELLEHDAELEAANQHLEARVNERTARLQQTLDALEASDFRLKTITDNLPVLIAYADADERYQFNNATFKDWFGVDADGLKGMTIEAFIGAENYQIAKPHIRRVLAGERVSYERRDVAADGSERFMEFTYVPNFADSSPDHGTPGNEAGVLGFYILVQDISLAKQVEQSLQFQAAHDGLTGALNRRGMEDLLGVALARSNRSRLALAVTFIDLDHFKQINDTYGHNAGDLLLKAVVERLRGVIRKTDSIARIAGDEFVVVLESLSESDQDYDALAQKMLNAIGAPVELDSGDTITVTASVGMAITYDSELTPEELIKRADLAMYEAKRTGRNRYHIECQ
ncbi:diguanylate cyclase domain-containing protein [Allohahella marinimesophila]|uniref:GGDEF domain-containing protein n=1 Tax=Allohahella marinimesophila TaxID=1054972 RepID=A0ABP7PMQ3_9GAMM